MSDYISRDIVIANVIEQMKHSDECAMRERLLNLEAADVRENKTGKWIPIEEDADFFGEFNKCSDCGAVVMGFGNYCSNCGARMSE